MVPALKNEDYEEEKIEQWSMTGNPTQRSWKDKYKFAEHSYISVYHRLKSSYTSTKMRQLSRLLILIALAVILCGIFEYASASWACRMPNCRNVEVSKVKNLWASVTHKNWHIAYISEHGVRGCHCNWRDIRSKAVTINCDFLLTTIICRMFIPL